MKHFHVLLIRGGPLVPRFHRRNHRRRAIVIDGEIGFRRPAIVTWTSYGQLDLACERAGAVFRSYCRLAQDLRSRMHAKYGLIDGEWSIIEGWIGNRSTKARGAQDAKLS